MDLLRRGWITGKLSNGKISGGDTYNFLGKYIIRNAVCTLQEYPKKDYRIYADDIDERCCCGIPEWQVDNAEEKIVIKFKFELVKIFGVIIYSKW